MFKSTFLLILLYVEPLLVREMFSSTRAVWGSHKGPALAHKAVGAVGAGWVGQWSLVWLLSPQPAVASRRHTLPASAAG